MDMSNSAPALFEISANMRSIYRVHKQLRDVNEKAYEPEIIAIGPYHRGRENLQMMEVHKSRYLESHLQRKNETLDKYVSAVRELEKEAWNFYAEPISLSADEFAEMLVRDGCFIIELLRKSIKKGAKRDNDPIFRMEWMMNGLRRDLLLFENQIPFFVLRKLFDLIEVSGQQERLIYLVLKFWENLHPGGEYKRKKNMNPEKIDHLLDLIHQNYLPSPAPDHVIVNVGVNEGATSMGRESLIIDSAIELTNANVKFEVKKSGSFFDINFHKGVIQMPTLTIEDRTECFLRNLIAYEQYFPETQPNYVTDYVRFLDCLIDSSSDVEILSQSGVINNWLGDDEVVAKIVNQLTKTVSDPGKGFMHAATFRDINTYSKKRWTRACAVLNRDYFNSPWAYATFFAASAILLLTIAQTVCSILQVT